MKFRIRHDESDSEWIEEAETEDEIYLKYSDGMCDVTQIFSCPICGKEFEEINFTDALSIREFQISGMCQECQDKTFGEDLPNEVCN